jgi:DtxR family Mn-dependent transcriptional regulator
LLEVFLSDELKIDPAKVHAEACRMEHYMTDETADALCRWLEAPARSPHDKLIMPCQKPIESCQQCEHACNTETIRTSGEKGIIPVTELGLDREGEIAFIRGDKKVVQRLCDLGLTLKTRVKLVRKAPRRGPVELFVRRTTLAIANDIADNIFVTRVEA